jgi:putative acetyltransferase
MDQQLAMTVRAERAKDQAAIRAVHTAAFGREAEADLVDALRRASGFDPGLSLVAERDGTVLGHILLSLITIHGTAHTTPALALAPMAVLPEHQRTGIGAELVRHAITAARDAGHRLIVVLGHPEYYPRLGFVRASRFNIACPFEVPEEAFMVLEVVVGAAVGAAGTVRYPPAFNEV